MGEYTYCSAQRLSTVDYLLLHNADLTTISKFEVLPVNGLAGIRHPYWSAF